MRIAELIRFTATSAVSHRLRSVLTALGIAIGVAAVVLLTSIGEGLHNYMLTQFTQFGTNIIGINPGKAKTFGMPTGVLNTVRPLNLDDAAGAEACTPCAFHPAARAGHGIGGEWRSRAQGDRQRHGLTK